MGLGKGHSGGSLFCSFNFSVVVTFFKIKCLGKNLATGAKFESRCNVPSVALPMHVPDDRGGLVCLFPKEVNFHLFFKEDTKLVAL